MRVKCPLILQEPTPSFPKSESQEPDSDGFSVVTYSTGGAMYVLDWLITHQMIFDVSEQRKPVPPRQRNPAVVGYPKDRREQVVTALVPHCPKRRGERPFVIMIRRSQNDLATGGAKVKTH